MLFEVSGELLVVGAGRPASLFEQCRVDRGLQESFRVFPVLVVRGFCCACESCEVVGLAVGRAQRGCVVVGEAGEFVWIVAAAGCLGERVLYERESVAAGEELRELGLCKPVAAAFAADGNRQAVDRLDEEPAADAEQVGALVETDDPCLLLLLRGELAQALLRSGEACGGALALVEGGGAFELAGRAVGLACDREYLGEVHVCVGLGDGRLGRLGERDCFAGQRLCVGVFAASGG